MTDTATSAPSAAPAQASAAPTTSSPSSSPDTGSANPAPVTSSNPSAPTAPEEFDVNKYLDKTFKTKINGVDKEVPLAKAIQDYQKFEAANEKFNKAAELEKSIAAKEALFKQDPRKALQELGHDPLAVAQQWLEDYLKEQEMSPEQKELNDLRREKEERNKTEAQKAEEAKKAEFEANVEARRQDLANGVMDAIDKNGMWRDERTIQAMADYMLNAFEAGMELTPDMAARLVKRDQQEYSKSAYGNMTGEQLFEILGEDNIKKVREFDVGRIKTPATQAAKPKPAAPKLPEYDGKMSLAEYNKKLRQGFGM
jgi:hypothetical protein